MAKTRITITFSLDRNEDDISHTIQEVINGLRFGNFNCQSWPNISGSLTIKSVFAVSIDDNPQAPF